MPLAAGFLEVLPGVVVPHLIVRQHGWVGEMLAECEVSATPRGSLLGKLLGAGARESGAF